MRKIIFKSLFKIIKIPISIILFKTPLKKKMINYIIHYRSRGTDSLIDKFLNKIFWEQYFTKLSEKKRNEIRDMTLANGEGKIWAEEYYKERFENLNDLKKIKVGNMSMYDAEPIYSDIINLLNDFRNDQFTLLQIGSSSGRDLNFFRNYFPKFDYISSDINDEILNFQKKRYSYNNFKFVKAYAQDIDLLIQKFSLREKKKLIFSIGAAQYLSPDELNLFFKKISNIQKMIFFLMEPIQISFLNKKNIKSDYRSDISYNHDYRKYAEENNLKISKIDIIKPYSQKHGFHYDTAHYYLNVISNENDILKFNKKNEKKFQN